MANISSKESILKRIAEVENKSASVFVDKQDFNNHEIFHPVGENKVTVFKDELEAISGKCFISETVSEQSIQLKEFIHSKGFNTLFCLDKKIASLLEKMELHYSSEESLFNEMEVGITGCEALVARTGSVVVSSFGDSGRQMNVFPPVHIVLAHKSLLVDFPEEAIVKIREKYSEQLPSAISFITGPSRTADIEKTLVLGAHGPKEFIVFLCLE